MLWQMSTDEWLISLAFISGLAYITGWFSDRILGSAGFGHIGNWLVILLGAYGGMYLYNYYGYKLNQEPAHTLAVILGSALIALCSLCAVKRFFLN